MDRRESDFIAIPSSEDSSAFTLLRTLVKFLTTFFGAMVTTVVSFCSLLIDVASYYLQAAVFYDNMLNVLNGRVDPKNKAVFVTGCESDVALTLAKKFDELGYTVFAAVKNISEEISSATEQMFSPNVHLIQCDVIKYREVTEAAKTVRKVLGSQRQLWAIVSAASFSPVNISSTHDLEQVIKVNGLGSARLTKAFLPLLRLCKKSRVIFVTSPAISNSDIPASVSYAFSRAAETSFGYVLRKELRPLDIFVTIFEPSSFAQAHADSCNSSSQNSPQNSPPATPDISDANLEPGHPLFSRQSSQNSSKPSHGLVRKSSLTNIFPCGKIEDRNELVEQLAAIVSSPHEPHLFVCAEKRPRKSSIQNLPNLFLKSH